LRFDIYYFNKVNETDFNNQFITLFSNYTNNYELINLNGNCYEHPLNMEKFIELFEKLTKIFELKLIMIYIFQHQFLKVFFYVHKVLKKKKLVIY
jgi:hypothetical protein